MKIGITGATGQLGRLVVQKLKEKTNANNLTALVRTPEKAVDMNIASRVFDYNKPETLAESLKGIDYLLLISSNEVGQRKRQHESVIKAAQQAGVKWIIYTSLLHADTSSLNLAAEHVATEQALAKSGITFTLLRNGWYTENYTASVPSAVKAGALVGSAGNGKISSAARADYAEAAAIVLTTPNNEGKTYELSGDESFTLTDLAAEISRQTGKTIPYNDLSEDKYAAVLMGAGLPTPLAKALASWDVSASKGDLYDDSHVLSKLIGHATTPLSVVVKKALNA
ncbi:MAG: SDR family oxidoreductase [Bacteroidales bacterium]|nr:SDR family oxidoreductase [Bacteroidales bacterium]